ncbi:MAG: hypothetical protein LC808_07570 [Actinobacteria bacterium]|nr:hypothetical protein [Actinomycetota bacterium]
MAVAAERGIAIDRTDLGQTIKVGAGAGVIAAVVMAMYAMVAGATYVGSGFFTPLYHIASTFISPKPMMTSMQNAMDGRDFYFTFGPALLGMMVHLMTGAIYGGVFALIARALKLSGAAIVAVGAVYGLVVLAFSSFLGLPIAAALFGGGDPISDMPKMVGWTTFTIEHVLFGAVVGLFVLLYGFRARSEQATR